MVVVIASVCVSTCDGRIKKEERPKEVDLEEEDGDLVDEEDQEENVIKDSVSGAAALDTTITPVVVVTTTPVPQNPTTERATLTTTESTPIDTTTESVVTTTTRTIILSTTTAIPSGQVTTTAVAVDNNVHTEFWFGFWLI